MPDSGQAFAYDGVQPTQAVVAWNSERYESSVTGKWQELPGAKIDCHVGPGYSLRGGLLVVTFTAEVLVGKPLAGSAAGLLDITFGGQKGHPQDDNHRFATAQSAEEWGSVTTIRAMPYPYDAASVRDATVQVIFNLIAGSTFGFQNWLLKLEAYPLTK